MAATVISTGTYITKQIAVAVMAGFAGVGVVLPMAWLPADPISAAFLGLLGGALQLSVPWVINLPDKPGRVQAVLILATSVVIAVFGNGFQIPLLDKAVDPDALWRVNTLMLAFIGISVPLYIKDIFARLASKGELK